MEHRHEVQALFLAPFEGQGQQQRQAKNFKVRTEVVSRFVKADIQNSLQLNFKQARNSYISEVSQQNFTLNQNIALTFPKIEKPQIGRAHV